MATAVTSWLPSRTRSPTATPVTRVQQAPLRTASNRAQLGHRHRRAAAVHGEGHARRGRADGRSQAVTQSHLPAQRPPVLPTKLHNKPISAYTALNYALKQPVGSTETKSCTNGKSPKPLETHLHTVQAAI